MTQRILLVDDSPDNLRLVADYLIAAGYEVDAACDGEEAVACFSARPADLVLLDVVMPRMDGFEACRRIRSLPQGGVTPIVLLTSLGDRTAYEEAVDSGADDFLCRPVQRTELLLRVKSLARLRRMNEEIRQSHALIAAQNEKLVSSQRQKDELATLLVHDLKSPLMGILGNAEFVEMIPGLDAEVRDSVRDVITSARSLQRMLLNLLDISRAEDGRLEPRPAPLDLPGVLEEVCGIYRKPAVSQRKRLVLQTELGEGAVAADADLLRRIVENLLDNSMKYSPPDSTIRVLARTDRDGGVDLRVTDEGPGIPEPYRDRIFEKYAQLDEHPEARSRSSRGLGLAFCRMAAAAQGGRIWVEPNQPRGSVFRLHLPGPSQQAACTTAASPADGQHPRR